MKVFLFFFSFVMAKTRNFWTTQKNILIYLQPITYFLCISINLIKISSRLSRSFTNNPTRIKTLLFRKYSCWTSSFFFCFDWPRLTVAEFFETFAFIRDLFRLSFWIIHQVSNQPNVSRTSHPVRRFSLYS